MLFLLSLYINELTTSGASCEYFKVGNSVSKQADPEAVVPVENEYSIPHALGSVDTSLLK
jgi:hypothetical protein